MRVTYVPLATVTPASTPIVSARGGSQSRGGEWPFDDLSSDVATMFGLPGTWNEVDPAGIDVYPDTGELTLPMNAVGWATARSTWCIRRAEHDFRRR